MFDWENTFITIFPSCSSTWRPLHFHPELAPPILELFTFCRAVSSRVPSRSGSRARQGGPLEHDAEAPNCPLPKAANCSLGALELSASSNIQLGERGPTPRTSPTPGHHVGRSASSTCGRGAREEHSQCFAGAYSYPDRGRCHFKSSVFCDSYVALLFGDGAALGAAQCSPAFSTLKTPETRQFLYAVLV